MRHTTVLLTRPPDTVGAGTTGQCPLPRKKSADVGIDSAHIARDSQDAGSGHPSPPLTGMPANNPEPHIRDQGVIRQVKLGVTPPRTQILTQDVTYSMLQ